MQDIDIDKNTRINPLAEEIKLQGSRDKGILMIHGYSGIPGDMKFIAQEIHKKTDYSIYIPRLPGHGTTGKDFCQSQARDWLRKTYDSYLKLKQSYKNIVVIGLSMGGLLAILTGARFKISKLALIAPALYSKNPKLPFSHILKHFRPVLKKPEEEIPDKNEFDSNQEWIQFKNYYSYDYTAPAAELHKLMKLTRKRLSHIECSTLILASIEDELVPLKAARKIENKINANRKKIILFNNSPHVINQGPEKEKCAQEIIDFIK